MFIALLTVGLLLAMVIPALGISRARKEIEVEKGSYSDVLKIKIEYPGSPEYLDISLNTIITKEEYLHRTSRIDERYPDICHDLLSIPGVTEIGASKYEIGLQKGNAFEFETDIIPLAIEIIKRHYGLYKEIEMLPVEDNRENARLRFEADQKYMMETGRSRYDDIY